jgi:hypothetical protein
VRSIVILAAVALSGVGCRDTTRPDSAIAAGSYRLVSVSGRGPASGYFILAPNGMAERRVRYAALQGGTSTEYVAVGTFQLRSTGIIEFDLREDGGHSEYVWHTEGEHTGGRFSIRYPDPADGNIEETYLRDAPID